LFFYNGIKLQLVSFFLTGFMDATRLVTFQSPFQVHQFIILSIGKFNLQAKLL